MSIEKIGSSSEKKPDSKIRGEQPIDSWTKKEFIEQGKMLLGAIREMSPDINGASHARSIFASVWIADHIRYLYYYMKRGNFTLEDIGIKEAELKNLVAPSGGSPRELTEEEREKIWRQVFEKQPK